MIPLNPPRSAFLEKAATARVLPVSCEIVADSDTPVSAFAKLCGDAPSFLLERALRLFLWRSGLRRMGRFLI